MATRRDKYYEKKLETLVGYTNEPLSNEKLRQAKHIFMEETEEEERNIISGANNVTMDNFCQSPVTTNTQGQNVNASERLNNLDELSETLKYLTIDSTINNSAYYN